MKKIISAAMIAVSLMLSSIPYVSANTNTLTITVLYDRLNAQPIIKDGNVMVPVKALSQKLNIQYVYDTKTNIVILTLKSNKKIQLKEGNKTLISNGVIQSMDVAPFETNGTLYVQLIPFAKEAGCYISYTKSEINLSPIYKVDLTYAGDTGVVENKLLTEDANLNILDKNVKVEDDRITGDGFSLLTYEKGYHLKFEISKYSGNSESIEKALLSVCEYGSPISKLISEYVQKGNKIDNADYEIGNTHFMYVKEGNMLNVYISNSPLK